MVAPYRSPNTPGAPLPLGVAATSILNVIPTTDSAYAFVTYQGTGGTIPEYIQSTSSIPGTLKDVALQTTSAGAPIAPVSGVFNSDNSIFFTGTTGDNLVHRLSRSAAGFADTLSPVIPALPGVNGGVAVPNFLAQRPKKSTS